MKWLIFFILTLAASALYFRYGIGLNKSKDAKPSKAESSETNSIEQPENFPGTGLPSGLQQPSTDLPSDNVPQARSQPDTIPPATVEVPPQVPLPGSNDFQPGFPNQPDFQQPFEPPPPSQVFPESEIPPPPPPPFFPENDSFNEVPPVDSPNAFDPPPYINNETYGDGYTSPPPSVPMDQENF